MAPKKSADTDSQVKTAPKTKTKVKDAIKAKPQSTEAKGKKAEQSTHPYTADEKTILGLYALFGAGGIMTILPFALVSYAGAALILACYIGCVYYRIRYKGHDAMQFHTTYLGRTFWWSSLILLVVIGLFCSVIIMNGDLSPIYQMMNDVQQGAVLGEADISAMQAVFVHKNMMLIKITAIMCTLPYVSYILYRVISGVKLLDKNR